MMEESRAQESTTAGCCRRRRDVPAAAAEEEASASRELNAEGDDHADDEEGKEKKPPRDAAACLQALPKGVREQIESKPYAMTLAELTIQTQMRFFDVDKRFLQLLDILEEDGKANDALTKLQKSLAGLQRRDVGNWRGYTYTLLRAFDPEAHQKLKQDENSIPREGLNGQVRQRRAGRKDGQGSYEEHGKKALLGPSAFNTAAPAFMPGKLEHGGKETTPLPPPSKGVRNAAGDRPSNKGKSEGKGEKAGKATSKGGGKGKTEGNEGKPQVKAEGRVWKEKKKDT